MAYQHATMDPVEQLAEAGREEAIRFPRQFVYIAGAVLAWTTFWELANRHQINPASVTLHWVCIIVAIWLAYTF